MSYRFDDVDYEDEVVQEEVVEKGVSSAVDPHNPYGANPKWFLPPRVGDDDEEDVDERVSEDLKRIQHRITIFTDTSSESGIDWKNIKKAIQSLQKALGRFMKRGQQSRDLVGEILATVQTLLTEWSTQADAKKNRTMDEVRVLVEEVELEYEKNEEKDDEDDDEFKMPINLTSQSNEDPAKVLARLLTQAVSSRRDALRLFKSVVMNGKTHSQPHLVAFALAGIVRSILSKFSREKCLSVEAWKESIASFTECVNTIHTHKLRVSEFTTEYTPEPTAAESESDVSPVTETFIINFTNTKTTVIQGGLQALYEDLFEEMRRMTTNNEKQFVQCLEAECKIVDLGFELAKNTKGSKIYSLIFSILSQRSPALHELMCKKFGLSTPFDIPALYKQCKPSPLTMLQYAYHLALIGQYRQANALLASDNSRSQILENGEDWGLRFVAIKEYAPVDVKIAYNRVIVQLALANFKDGNASEAADLISSIRENPAKWGILFGQGAPYSNFQLPKDMRARTALLFNSIQTPPHYHIPHNSVELMYFVAIAMKRAIPTAQGIQNYVNDSFAGLRRNINEVAGSASTANEFVLDFDDSLQSGDMQKMMNALNNLPFWNIIDGEVSKAKIAAKAKAIALQCFIYSSAANFSSITSKYLQERFEMSEAEVRKTINQLILTSPDYLTAYWESNAEDSIVVERCNVAGLRKTLGQAARNTGNLQVPSL